MIKYVLFTVLVSVLLAGCSTTSIYPDNPYVNDPVIERIAVAPMLIAPSVASVQNLGFEDGGLPSFQTSDGRTAHYSVLFAEQFARGLPNFPGITVVTPDMVVAAWKGMEEAGTPANPMASPEQARAVGRSLKVDAILTARVLMWDPFGPKLVIEWALHYCKARSRSAMDVRMLERAGKGGTLSGFGSGDAPVYAEQIDLDAQQQSTQNLLDAYGDSLAPIPPYKTGKESVIQEANPRYLWFAAWAAMNNAFAYQRARMGD